VAAATAATATPSICDFAFTHFPPGRENDNVPEGWTQKRQQKAGNDQPDELLKIALAGYPVPNLQVWPIYYLLNNQTEVPLSCWAAQASAQAFTGTRRLAQTRSNAFVVKPATYKVEYMLMNRNRLAGISPNGSLTSPPLSIKLENFGDVVSDVSLRPGRSSLVVGGGTAHVHTIMYIMRIGPRPPERAPQLCQTTLSALLIVRTRRASTA
jgi:hypothetical protein